MSNTETGLRPIRKLEFEIIETISVEHAIMDETLETAINRKLGELNIQNPKYSDATPSYEVISVDIANVQYNVVTNIPKKEVLTAIAEVELHFTVDLEHVVMHQTLDAMSEDERNDFWKLLEIADDQLGTGWFDFAETSNLVDFDVSEV